MRAKNDSMIQKEEEKNDNGDRMTVEGKIEKGSKSRIENEMENIDLNQHLEVDQFFEAVKQQDNSRYRDLFNALLRDNRSGYLVDIFQNNNSWLNGHEGSMEHDKLNGMTKQKLKVKWIMVVKWRMRMIMTTMTIIRI